MLQSISWQEFLTTIAVIVVLYYAITGLLLYHREIINIFKQKASNHTALKKENDRNESNDLLGAVKQVDQQERNVSREEKISAEEINVSPVQQDEEAIIPALDPDEEATITSVANLHQDVRTVAEIISTGNKEDAADLFQTLLSNYSHLVGTAYQNSSDLFIRNTCKEHCQFDLSFEEIRSWWPQNQNNNDNQ